MRNLPTSPGHFLLAAAALLVVVLSPVPALAQEGDWFASAVQKGPLYAGLGAFAGGLLVTLTPCVYPMIAITVSVFGARQATSRREAMLLSTCFVLGIVAMFTPLGLFAGLTGSLFGSLLSNPYVVVGLSLVFLALAASMFGAFEMVLPEPIMRRLSGVGGLGYGGAFALGLVSGIVAAPCTGPVLTTILLLIGNLQDARLGALLMLAFSLGLGLPFWLVGTFAVRLPKSGAWMVAIKSFFGIVMLVTALYFLRNAVPALAKLARPDTTFALASAAGVVLGVALGAIHLSWDQGLLARLRKGVGIVLTTAGAFLFVLWMGAPRGSLTWEESEAVARQKAATEKRPLLVDFTATWCGACNELARVTFADPRVQERAANFVAVKVDATHDDDPEVEAILKRYEVVGLPTVVVYDSQGVERKRFKDFVPPEAFLAEIEGIR